MRTRSVLAKFASLTLLSSAVSSPAKVFQLPGGAVDLEDVSATVEVYYRFMRLSYASNAWNFELVLRNTAVVPLTGPVVALVESYQNSSGPVGTDGQDAPELHWVSVRFIPIRGESPAKVSDTSSPRMDPPLQIFRGALPGASDAR